MKFTFASSRVRKNAENWLHVLISGIQKNSVPLLELLRKRSTQVPYTCRKCRKDHKNCTLISEFWKKKKRLFLIESPCSNYHVSIYCFVPTENNPSFSSARSHQPTRFSKHGHPAVTSNWVQSPHVGVAAVQVFCFTTNIGVKHRHTESVRKKVKTSRIAWNSTFFR